MKVALVIEQFSREGGGAERSTDQICRHLIRRGHEVTLLCGRGKAGEEDRLSIRSAGLRRMGFAWNVLSFRRWAMGELRTGRFDATISVTTVVPAMIVQPRSGTIGETLERNVAIRRTGLSRLGKRATIAFSPKQQTLLWCERQTIADPSVRAFAAVSGYVKRQLQERYGVESGRIRVIANAADMPPATVEQREEWRRSLRAGMDIGAGTTAFLFAAHNPRLKGIGTLLEAGRRLRDSGQDFALILAGSDEHYWLNSQAAALGIGAQVRVVGKTSRMAELYCAADVTVLPTYYDPASKVVIESLMMGTPAISTSYNGASDFIEAQGAGRRGRVVAEADDAAGLAQAMRELCDAGERDRCRAASTGLAESLSMERHVDALLRLLDDVVGAKAVGA